MTTPESCYNKAYPPSGPDLKLKSRELSLVHNIYISCSIALKFGTGHGNDTAVLCAKCQNDLTTDKWVTGKRDFTRFEYTMNFGGTIYLGTTPWVLQCFNWGRIRVKAEGTLSMLCSWTSASFNSLRPRQNGRHFPEDTFICIFVNEKLFYFD